MGPVNTATAWSSLLSALKKPRTSMYLLYRNFGVSASSPHVHRQEENGENQRYEKKPRLALRLSQRFVVSRHLIFGRHVFHMYL